MKAYLVLGAESSGTRMVTGLLVANGCVGTDAHVQPFDKGEITGARVVWRRSVPHNFKMLELGELLAKLGRFGYHSVTAVVTVRDEVPCAASQVKHRHVDTLEEARQSIRKAYGDIFVQLTHYGIPFVLAVYESLTGLHGSKAQAGLVESLGLTLTKALPLYDGDAKWWRK